jgi:hypothetical protein
MRSIVITIVAGNAETQCVVAIGGEVHLIAMHRERLHELASGFLVVFNNEDVAVPCSHDLPLPGAFKYTLSRRAEFNADFCVTN